MKTENVNHKRPFFYHLFTISVVWMSIFFGKYLFKVVFFSPWTSKIKVSQCSNIFMSFVYSRRETPCLSKKTCNFVLEFPSRGTHFSFSQWKISRLLFPQLSTLSVQYQNMKYLNLCLLNFSNFIEINIVRKCMHCI